jgi:hypothetical protein
MGSNPSPSAFCAAIAQRIEQRPRSPLVASWNLASGTLGFLINPLLYIYGFLSICFLLEFPEFLSEVKTELEVIEVILSNS